MGPRLKQFAQVWCGILLLVPSGMAGQFSSAPSFGSMGLHKKVMLRRQLPPITNVQGKTVEVRMDAGVAGPVAEVQTAIESFLRDGDAKVGGTNPTLRIDAKITQYNPPTQTPAVSKTASPQLAGLISVAFRIVDPHTRALVASGNAPAEINQEVKTGPLTIPGFGAKRSVSGVNSVLDAEKYLVTDAARQVASYLVSTPENVEALLASGGALNEADKLAVNGLWSRDLDALEAMPAYSDAKQEAYRTYNLGVANEALGYAAHDATSALAYLQKANVDYGKAIAAKPEEKFFIAPQNRIKSALEHYQRSMDAVADAERAATAPSAKPADAPLTNDDVIAMVSAGMDQANVLDNIASATKVSFDLSPNGQVELTHGKVNGVELMAMKAKAKGLAAPAVAPAAATAPAAAKKR